ncbi:C-5 cytosine-specific DNA methylase [Agrobacterium deltaense Zutra 3/1]|uniref:DNA (cytosine-5-)-methyltransferase n=1 Tax=Agrobacterium deltaense Zutra 3/1 TaxID=1183427 RepID=A0A1S7QRJ7_9HYPH|nr:DNA cytosine methyltransferase [Agrobacterium deltaense]CUX40630.1 C-5 cytosine-specific DNA methylase [Agrobacterium deltaense Zutra 3/1]
MNAHAGNLFDLHNSVAIPAIGPNGPYIIDSFAGGGGASTGIEQALGRSPDYAINHNAAALALHEANHPDTIHLSENVYKIDPLDHLRGKHIGLAWFSPDCKHFSKAKGGKPVERNIRDLCWIIPGWIERIQQSGGVVDVVMMENVEEFKDYGPLIETPRGLMPDPEKRGQSYQKWCKAIRRLGGKMQSRELRGCDYGAPTIRKRLFIIIRFDGQPLVWPEPTHGRPDDPDVIAGRKLPWPIVGDCIDYSLPCPSIFDTSEEIRRKHGVIAKRPLADNSMARVARGFDRFVLRSSRPYLVQIGYGERAGQAPRCMGVDQPLGTVVAGGVKHALMVPHVMTMRNAGKPFSGCDEPTHTITAGGAHQMLVSPVLTYARQAGADSMPASEKDQNAVICAFMAQHNNDSRRIGGVNPGRPASKPLSVITQTGSHQQLVAAYVARDFGTSTGHSMLKPCGTVMPEGQGKTRLITPFLQSYYGTGDGGREDESCRTITTRDRFGHIEASIDVPPFTEAQAERARHVADFMRSYGLWDEREFVTLEIDDVTFVVVDIGMRMLTPRELYTAQGFPADYQIDGYYDRSQIGHNGGPVWVPFSKEVQISCVGNSVCPPVAKALAAANCSHLAVQAVAA